MYHGAIHSAFLHGAFTLEFANVFAPLGLLFTAILSHVPNKRVIPFALSFVVNEVSRSTERFLQRPHPVGGVGEGGHGECFPVVRSEAGAEFIFVWADHSVCLG